MAVGYTPIYQIFKGGQDITDRFNDRTTNIKVELNSRGAEGDKCEITVDDRDWKIAFPDLGGALEVWLGYAEVGLAYMGSFKIDEVTFKGPPRDIMLHGNSTGMGSSMKAPIVQEFKDKTVGEILGALAGSGGIGFGGESGVTGLKIPYLNQLSSPYHIIHQLERLTGGTFKIANGKLMAIPRDAGISVNGEVQPILIMGPEHFGQWTVRHTIRPDFKGVQASYWDAFEQARKWTEFAGGSEGGANSGGSMFQMGKMFKSQAEAAAAAKSQMGGLMRDGVRAQFIPAKGDPWIRDGQRLLITRMRDGIDGSYVIEKATHTYVKSTGLMSNLECEAPGTADDYAALYKQGSDSLKDFLTLDINETLGEYLLRRGGVLPSDGAAP